jgi:hypothetical protein
MATPLEIVRGISQVISNTHDGALDDKGEPIKIGLKREEGHPIHDSRVMDGFGVKLTGDSLIVTYHADIKLKEVHAKDFESDLDQMITDIVSFLKKEFRKVTGETLSLKAKGELEALVQSTSRVRTWVQAQKEFTIGNLEGVESIGSESEDRLDPSFRKFLDQGGFKKA